MATRNRDVRLGVEIETTGEESLRKAAADLRSFARDGGEAAAQFNVLADNFDRLADQAASTAGLRALNEQFNRLTTESNEASAAADRLTRQYAEQRAELDRLRNEQAQAAEAVRQAKIALQQANGDLKTYSLGVTKATKDTAAYQTQLKAYGAAVETAKLQLVSKRAELDRYTPRVREATAAERALAAQSLAASDAARSSAAAVRERAAALQQAEAAALAAGVSTQDLAAAEAQLDAQTRELVQSANRLAQEQRDTAAAAEALAAVDAQLAGVQERLQATLTRSAQAYEQEQAALREAAAAAEAMSVDVAESAAAMRELEKAAARAETELRNFIQAEQLAERAAREAAVAQERRAAASDEQAEADRLAAIQARGLAEAQERGRLAAQAELAAIKDSEEFTRRYAERLEKTRAAVAAAGNEVEKAFGQTGVRSMKAIEAEIRTVDRSMERLRLEFLNGAISVRDFDRAASSAALKIAALKREIQTIPGNATGIEKLADGVNNLVTRFGALTAAVATVGFAVKPVLDATVALDQMRRVLTTVSGDAEQAAQQIEFLRDVSRRSGQQFDQLGESYSKFAASALQSGLTLKDTQDVFESVALAAGNLGLSSDQTKRALEALSQIASKGVVNMEELRQQLGDALPGVLPLLAKQLGLTQAELTKLVESGQLLASEAIPAIGVALRNLGPARGEVEGLIATWNRFINITKEAATIVTEGPIGRAIGAVAKFFGLVAEGLGGVAVVVSQTVDSLVFKLAGLASVLKGDTSWQDYLKQVEEFDTKARAVIDGYVSRMTLASGANEKVGKSAAAAGTSFSKLVVEQEKAIDAAELRTRVSEKLAQAVEVEAASVDKNVVALLEEREAVQRSLEIADRVASARAQAAAAAQAEVDVLRAARRARVEEGEQLKKTDEQIRESVKVLDEKIQKAEADAEKTRAQAQAARESADAARLAARTYGDQSGQLEQLRGETEKARKELEFAILAFQAGEAGAKDLERAEKNLAEAKRVLRDAIDDVDEALKRQIDTMKTEAEFSRAQIDLEITKLEIQKTELEQRGLNAAAAKLGLQIKDLELKKTVVGNDAKRDEANAIIRATTVRLEELRASGQLTPQMEAELNTRIRQQQTVILQADATSLQTDAQKKNQEASKASTESTNRHSESQRQNKTAVDDTTRSLEQQVQAFSKLAEASTLWSAKTAAAYNKAKEALEGLIKARIELDQYDIGGTGNAGAGNLGGDVTGVRSANNGTSGNLLTPSPGSLLSQNGTVRTAGGFQAKQPPGSGWTFVPDQRAFGGVSPADAAAGNYPIAPTTTRVAVNGVGYWVRSQADAQPTGGYDSPFGGYAGSSQQRADQAAASAAKTVTVNLNVNGGKPIPVVTTESDAERLLRELELAQGTGG